MALQFVAEKFPGHGITRLAERVILFKHDYNSSNILQVRSGSKFQNYTLVDKMNACYYHVPKGLDLPENKHIQKKGERVPNLPLSLFDTG